MERASAERKEKDLIGEQQRQHARAVLLLPSNASRGFHKAMLLLLSFN